MNLDPRWVALLACLAPVAPSIAQTPVRNCPGFHEGKASRAEADQFYAARIRDIMSAAKRGDRQALAVMVSPRFSYMMKQADLFLNSRKDTGVESAIDLARQLKPNRYEVTSEWDMFYQVISKCAWTVDVTFHGPDSDMRAKVTFTFADGLLANAQGKWMPFVTQDIP